MLQGTPVRSIALAVTAAAAAFLAGCKNDDAVLGVTPPVPPGTTISLSRDVQPIFNRSCALSPCHAGASPQENMNLESGRIFDPGTGAVGVQSLEAPPLKRIEPGSSAASYLVAKLEGNQVSAGGCCERMPLGGPYLSSTEIQVIRDWIDQGALDN